MANAPQVPSRLTISFQVEGFPAAIELDVNAADLAVKVETVVKAIKAAGGTAPTLPAPSAQRSEPVATGEPPAGLPADVREAWTKKVPFGRNKGQALGEQSDKELSYLAKECRMADVQAAAKRLMIHRLGG